MRVRADVNRLIKPILLVLIAFSVAIPLSLHHASAQEPPGFVGAVYVMSNRSDTNTVVAYGRNADGTLTLIDSFASGGPGTGPLHPPSLAVSDANDPLISADALRLSLDGNYVLAVNSLGNSLSAFRILPDYRLELTSTIGTEGSFPNSVAEYNGTIFVTHIGEVFDDENAIPIDAINASVNGFRLDPTTGTLTSLGVRGELSTAISRPSDVQFAPGGQVVVVSEINSGNFVSWTVGNDGSLNNRLVFEGNTTIPANDGSGILVNANPLGFRIVEGSSANYLVATEAREAPAFAVGTVSVYTIDGTTGQMAIIAQGIEAPGQETTCWIAFNDTLTYFWTSNSRTNSISSFSFDSATGNAALLRADEVVRVDANGLPASAPIDMAASPDGRYLYQLFGRTGTVGVYAINDDGSLSFVEEQANVLPNVGTQGIVAR